MIDEKSIRCWMKKEQYYELNCNKNTPENKISGLSLVHLIFKGLRSIVYFSTRFEREYFNFKGSGYLDKKE